MLPSLHRDLAHYTRVEATALGETPLCPVCQHIPMLLIPPLMPVPPYTPAREIPHPMIRPHWARFVYFDDARDKQLYLSLIVRQAPGLYRAFHLDCSPWCRVIGLYLICPAIGSQIALDVFEQRKRQCRSGPFEPPTLLQAAGKTVARATRSESFGDFCQKVDQLPIPRLLGNFIHTLFPASVRHISDHQHEDQFRNQILQPPCLDCHHTACCCTC